MTIVTVSGDVKTVQHKIGNYYISPDQSLFQLVAYEARECCLVDVKNGNRWKSGIKVNNAYDISQAEFNEICGSKVFKKVAKVTITYKE